MSAPPQTFSHYPGLPLPAHVRVPLTVLPGHACSYLPGRMAVNRALWVQSRLPGEVYHDFMDAGFRRSGRLLYQPVCPGCRECRAIRVPVARFAPSRSQRRCARRNADFHVTVGRAVATQEKFDLYRRYATQWHGATEPLETREAFEAFLYDSPVETIEFCYREPQTEALRAVGICDVCSRSLSSMYFYFDPAHARRGLGTFGALVEIEHARANGIAYYYLGYCVEGCGAMSYKASFRPNETLDSDGIWRESSPP